MILYLVGINVGETINSPTAIQTLYSGQLGRIEVKIFRDKGLRIPE